MLMLETIYNVYFENPKKKKKKSKMGSYLLPLCNSKIMAKSIEFEISSMNKFFPSAEKVIRFDKLFGF